MPKMTVRVILKSGVEFSIKCDKFTLTRNGFQQVTGYNIEGIAAARYSAIRLTDARSASGFKRLSRKRGGGYPIVLLIPARTDTAYFHDYIYGKAEIRFVRGRLRFTDDDGNAADPAPFPSMVVIYNGERVKNE